MTLEKLLFKRGLVGVSNYKCDLYIDNSNWNL